MQAIANYIATSDYFIGLDSGFAHMANALGKRGKVLIANYQSGKFTFKNFNPFTGNYAKPGVIMYAPGGLLSTLTSDAVLEEVLKELQPITSLNQQPEYNSL